MYQENIYIRKRIYMYREVRNICITFEIYVSGKYQKPHICIVKFEIYVSGKYIYQKPHICIVKFEIYVSGSENIYITFRKSDTCFKASGNLLSEVSTPSKVIKLYNLHHVSIIAVYR